MQRYEPRLANHRGIPQAVMITVIHGQPLGFIETGLTLPSGYTCQRENEHEFAAPHCDVAVPLYICTLGDSFNTVCFNTVNTMDRGWIKMCFRLIKGSCFDEIMTPALGSVFNAFCDVSRGAAPLPVASVVL